MKYLLCFSVLLLSLQPLSAAEKEFTILFAFNQTNLPDSSMLSLIRFIHAKQIDKVVIEGHCDSVGSRAFNYVLSEKRAREVKKLLIENGIRTDLVKTCIGYGEDRPLTVNETEQDRQLNRRVNVHFYYQERDIARVDTMKAHFPDRAAFKKGHTVALHHILFNGGRHTLKEESMPELERLCSLLKESPTMKIQIEGHVCCTTTEPDGYDVDTHTDSLSVNRAKVIYTYLVRQCGIAKDRLQYKGFGGTRKIIEADETEEQQQVNRRVEIRVLNE